MVIKVFVRFYSVSPKKPLIKSKKLTMGLKIKSGVTPSGVTPASVQRSSSAPPKQNAPSGFTETSVFRKKKLSQNSTSYEISQKPSKFGKVVSSSPKGPETSNKMRASHSPNSSVYGTAHSEATPGAVTKDFFPEVLTSADQAFAGTLGNDRSFRTSGPGKTRPRVSRTLKRGQYPTKVSAFPTSVYSSKTVSKSSQTKTMARKNFKLQGKVLSSKRTSGVSPRGKTPYFSSKKPCLPVSRGSSSLNFFLKEPRGHLFVKIPGSSSRKKEVFFNEGNFVSFSLFQRSKSSPKIQRVTVFQKKMFPTSISHPQITEKHLLPKKSQTSAFFSSKDDKKQKKSLKKGTSRGQNVFTVFPGVSSKVSQPVESPDSLEYSEAVKSFRDSFEYFKKRKIFEVRYRRFVRQFTANKALIYPRSGDSHHWPLLESKHGQRKPLAAFVVDPPKLWAEASLNSHRHFPFFLKYSHFFKVSWGSRKKKALSRFGRRVSRLFSRLMRKFYYSMMIVHRCTPIIVPQGFFFNSLEQKFFKFFFRPLWDYYDNSLTYEHCLDDSVYGNQQWLKFVVSILPLSRASIRETFLFQFVEREHRFWFGFFYDLAHPQREQLPLVYMELFYPFLWGNPSWTLYLLNRLVFILPFLPSKVRSLFFRLGRHLRFYCQHVWQQLQLKESLVQQQAQDLEFDDESSRIITSWFRKQTYYRKNLDAKTFQQPALAVIRRIAAKTAFNRWLPLHYPQLCSLILKKKTYLRKSASSSLSASRNSLRKSPEISQDSSIQDTTLSDDIFVTFSYKVCWSLLLFWFLVFFVKISVQKPVLFSQNLINAYAGSFPLFVGDFFYTLYSYFLRYSSTDDSLYSFACAFWTTDVGSRSGKIYRHRRARQFFIWSYPRRNDSPSTVYRRYQYVRQLPFSSFGYFWSRLVNTNNNTFYPRPKQSTSTPPEVQGVLSPATMVVPLPFVRSASVYGSRPQVPLEDPTTVLGSYRFDRIAKTRFN